MNLNKESMVRRGRDSQSGQSLVLIAFVLLLLFAAAAVSIDMGNLYFCYSELQSATQAAARAGGAAMSNAAVANATTLADYYSGASVVGGRYNIPPNGSINITGVTVNYACVSTTAYPGLDLPPCATYTSVPTGCTVTTSNPAGGCNAIQVIENATVSTFFAKLFGVGTINISSAASASAAGGGAVPYHVMTILDSTASMGSGSDTGCLASNPTGAYTPEQCAQYGIQTLLSGLAPCASNLANCGSSPAVDQVGLMTFPGLCDDIATGITGSQGSGGNCPNASTLNNTTANATYAPDDYNCKGKTPPIAEYNSDPEYLILPFQNNYRNSDSSGLNTGSNLVQSVAAGSGGCGIQTPGGEGTFYAGVIVAAQQYLMANHTNGIQDVMIILSDGNATASGTQMGGTVKQTQTVTGMTGNLFSATNECAQAVAAADWAKTYTEADGTKTEIYSVSYNSSNVQCQTDKTSITDCQTMQDIGSTPSSQYFFSVPGKKGGTICSGAVPITQLDQVFSAILTDLQGARLIPNNVF
jgi:hypothetical protein